MRQMIAMVPVALLAVLCFSCNSVNRKAAKADDVTLAPVGSGTMAADTSVMMEDAQADKEDEQVPGNPGNAQQRNNVPPPPPAFPDWDKKIIKTADLHIEVKDFQRYTSRLHNAVKASGGYIAQEELTQSLGEIDNTVSIKVPVARFEELIQQLPSDSDRLVEKKITSEDVTMEFVDTKSKLETKKEVRERYLDLLKQARSMKDIIAIQNEINDIQEEMDEASGRITWLGHSSAYSTVNLRFYQVLDARVRENPSPSFFWSDEGFSGRGLESIQLPVIRDDQCMAFVDRVGLWRGLDKKGASRDQDKALGLSADGRAYCAIKLSTGCGEFLSL